MMMVGVVLGVVCVIVVVDVIDQDQDQLADLSSAFWSGSSVSVCGIFSQLGHVCLKTST